MKNLSSLSLFIMGIGLLPVAHFIDNLLLKSILALGSIVLSIMAIVKNIREKKENN